ncbi:nose resistant to fluoxetine protein 6 [Agrilus planipennis]|uniref:Nose resistant to fluoxetine protein 6 n=1 Tax=Agrilus planipennis TaxID=224129 RepID=A0A1W4X0F9_AGRPL|nr:nose resistant to fluoxetine protein 6 [Agrilus planipennis]
MQSFFSCLLCLTTLFAFFITSGNLKVDFIEPSATNNLEENVILEVVDKTNLTVFEPVFVDVNLKNVCDSDFDAVSKSKVVTDETESGPTKARKCIRNIEKCIEEDVSYTVALAHMSKRLFTSIPPLDFTSVKGISNSCKYQNRLYLQALKRYELWALSMYDSSAKIPSGILSGNINQLGDFDECLNAVSEKWNIEGQYCLASLQVQEPTTRYLHAIYSLVHSYSPFKSKLRDPGHRVPRYSSISWALCVPKSCSASDVSLGLKNTVDEIFNNTGLTIQLDVDPSMCQSKPKEPLPFSTKLVGCLFLTVVALGIVGTIFDYLDIPGTSEWLLCFSFRKNVKTLFSTKRPSNDIEAIHGVRFLNALCLIMAHKALALFFVPYMNRTEMSEILGKPWSVFGRAASLYTDPFIMMSGTLTAYSFISKLKKSEKINIVNEYVSRIMRILPTLGALILFCTFLLPFLSNGPYWNQVVTHHSDICKQHWWRNLLFIHNYFGFENMCLTHTHHTGIDTQLFFLSPFLVLMIWKWPRRGSLGLIAIAIISTIMRFLATYTKNLSNYIHYGTSIQQLFRTADYMYIIPAHRLTVYVMGIFLGYMLHTCQGIKLNKFHLWIGHVVALLFFVISLAGPSFMGHFQYVYNPLDAAWYAAIVPIFWCLSFAWIIFTHQMGYKSLAGDVLSWRGFLFTTRISYTVYLTQFPVFFFNVGVTRHSDYYGFFLKNINIKETFWIILLSTILTLLIEMPFNNIRNIVFSKQRTKLSLETKKTE